MLIQAITIMNGHLKYFWQLRCLFSNLIIEDMISLTVTGEGGCTSSDSLQLLYDLPIVNNVDNSEICIGESISLNTNAGYINYNWSPSRYLLMLTCILLHL